MFVRNGKMACFELWEIAFGFPNQTYFPKIYTKIN